MKKTDSQVNYRDWYIADCSIPFGSGLLRPGFNNFEESDGRRWIYLWLLLAMKKTDESNDGLYTGSYLYPFDNRWSNLDASGFDNIENKIETYYFPNAQTIILDTGFKILESTGRGRHWSGFYRTPIENQPELIEFFSPRPWLEYKLIGGALFEKNKGKEEQYLRQTVKADLTKFIDHFGWEIVQGREGKEEDPELTQKRKKSNQVAREIAEEMVKTMSESKLENFRYDHFFYGPQDIPWQLIFEDIWSLFCLVEGRATMDRSTFNHYMWQVKLWNNIMKLKDSSLNEALTLYMEKFPKKLKKYKGKSLRKRLFKPEIFKLRKDMESLHMEKSSKEKSTNDIKESASALEAFVVRCYEALVDELEGREITNRCGLCRLPIFLTTLGKPYCTSAVEKKDCNIKAYYKKYYPEHREEIQKRSRAYMRKYRAEN